MLTVVVDERKETSQALYDWCVRLSKRFLLHYPRKFVREIGSRTQEEDPPRQRGEQISWGLGCDCLLVDSRRLRTGVK